MSLFGPDITSKTSPASFVCSGLNFDFDPPNRTPRGETAFYDQCSKYHTQNLFSFPAQHIFHCFSGRTTHGSNPPY